MVWMVILMPLSEFEPESAPSPFTQVETQTAQAPKRRRPHDDDFDHETSASNQRARTLANDDRWTMSSLVPSSTTESQQYVLASRSHEVYGILPVDDNDQMPQEHAVGPSWDQTLCGDLPSLDRIATGYDTCTVPQSFQTTKEDALRMVAQSSQGSDRDRPSLFVTAMLDEDRDILHYRQILGPPVSPSLAVAE